MKAIIAINNLGYIGLKNKMPWVCPADLKHFKKLTLHKKVLVGYNTFKKLPKLPNREVLLDEKNIFIDDCDDIWCIGGAKTYLKYAHSFTEIHISYINDYSIGDTFAPNIKLNDNCKIYKYNFNLKQL